MSTFLCKNGVRKEYFLTPTFIIEPKKGLSYTYKDITGTMIFLKEFLHLRDSREDFQAVKEGGYVGIPCFLFEDGSLTFSVEEAIVWSGKAK
jgi:glutaredoxin-related protein